MNLQLSKPLVVFDLETTGLDIVQDRIVEISLLKIEIDGKRSSITKRVNPGKAISAESSAIHGIYDKDVQNEPLFKQIAAELKKFIGNSDLAGFNSNKFDIPMLMEEFLRNDVEFDVSKRKCIDVQNIFHKMEKRTLEAAYQFYCNRTIENAHSAEADVNATFEVLEAQLEKYPDLSPTAEYLSEFSSINRSVDLAGRIVRDTNNAEVFNFGKYKGQSVLEIFKKDPGYYTWMMNADFSQDTKKHLTAIKLREKNS
ncbi:MAG TPA: DNA polymerase III subunit epsilon [Flavobacteriales bacterium]|nr:DNA polymerase III subunit epsilon [Flavobacteriales bacterium]